MSHKFKIGQRVESTEVPAEDMGNGTGQVRQLEIIEMLENGKVRCKHFREGVVNPKVSYHEVSIDSLSYISDKPLVKKELKDDPFWKNNRM